MSRRKRNSDVAKLASVELRRVLEPVELDLETAVSDCESGGSPRRALMRARTRLGKLLEAMGVTFAAFVLLFASSACDPCWSTPVHVDRCQHGDDASCEWLLEHLDEATGACEVRR